jgi:transposase
MSTSESFFESSESALSASEWPPSPTPSRAALPRPPVRRQRRRQEMSRDQRLQVQTLRTAGLSQREVSLQLNLTRDQVRYAASHPPTPSRRSGRPGILSQEEIERIIEWVCASPINRRCSWERIPRKLDLNISYYAVRYTLRKAGFSRRLTRRKPPISERNRQARLDFAREYRDWTPEQWKSILWTDEIW